MSNVPEWASSLPPELQALELVKNTPDLTTAVKRLVDLNSYKGASLALPKDGDEASQKAFAEAVTKRGFIPGEVPADPDGYEVEVDLESVGLGEDWKQGRLKEFHALGLTKSQAKAALSREVEAMQKAFEGLTDADRANIQKATDRYGVNGDPSAILKMLKEIGENMTEDNTRPGSGTAAGPTTVEEIDVQLANTDDELMKVPEYDPRSKSLLDKRYTLLKQRAALMSGDKSVLDVPFERFAKTIGRR